MVFNIYVNAFINMNMNSLIKHEFPESNQPLVIPNFDFIFYIPNKLNEWILYFYTWVQQHFDGPKGLWLTGVSKSGKTSLCATLGLGRVIFNMFETSFSVIFKLKYIDLSYSSQGELCSRYHL